MYSFVIVGSLILFVISERTFLHFSRTARRAFWYILSCAVGVWLVKWLQNVEGVGMVWIFLSAVLAASVVEDEVSKKTGLTPLNIEATQRVRAAYRTPEAQGKSERIMDIVGSITRGKGYTAGTKQLVSRVSGATRRLQRSLHTVLAQATTQELNYIMCAVNVAAMIEVATTETLDMLCDDKLPVLGTVARSALVDGLQKLGLRYRPQRQAWARTVILQTKGMQLTNFKAYIDDGGDYHSMYKLVYSDLQGVERKAVLQHLQSEGASVLKQLESAPGDRPRGAVLKILSDIDDTVFSSGGSFPAGIDTRYPRKCYYPGVLALYAAMDRCFAKRHAALLNSLAEDEDEDDVVTSAYKGGNAGTNNDDQPTSESIALDGKSEPGRPPGLLRTLSPPIPCLRTGMIRSSSTLSTGASPPSSFSARRLHADLVTPRDKGATMLETIMSPRAHLSYQPEDPHSIHHHQEGSNLVFLSARPESYKGYTESESYRKYFQPLVLRGDLDTSPTMLLGSLDSGPRALMKLFRGEWLIDNANPKTAAAALYQTLAIKKVSRFREYATIYPEAAFVYMGDNGQGDVLCAEILESSAKVAAADRPSQLLGMFIHRVVPPTGTLSKLRNAKSTKEDLLDAWDKKGIFFHRTHVGMATKAYELGLLDAEGLHQVMATAAADFRRVWSRYGGRYAGRNLGKAARHLNKDIVAANLLMPSHLHVPLVEAPIMEDAIEGDRSVVRREASVALSEINTELVPMN